MLTLKICVGVFSGTLKARMMKLGIHIDNELLYCWMENRTPCSYSSLYLSIFLSFMAQFVSQFSTEMCKLEFSNMVYICRMSDYIVGLRLRVMALIFLFLSIFLSFPILHVNINICVGNFSRIFQARMLKLGIHMDNGIENRTPRSYYSLYLSIFYPVFFVFVYRLFRIRVTVFFATYLLLLLYCSAFLKQCSGAIVRFCDSFS